MHYELSCTTFPKFCIFGTFTVLIFVFMIDFSEPTGSHFNTYVLNRSIVSLNTRLFLLKTLIVNGNFHSEFGFMYFYK